MCFKRKPKVVEYENAKYKLDKFVSFKYGIDLRFGRIVASYLDQDGKVSYDIQIGGECPAILKDIKEKEIVGIRL